MLPLNVYGPDDESEMEETLPLVDRDPENVAVQDLVILRLVADDVVENDEEMDAETVCVKEKDSEGVLLLDKVVDTDDEWEKDCVEALSETDLVGVSEKVCVAVDDGVRE